MKIYHDGSWTEEELIKLANKEPVDRNGKRYIVCWNCQTIVRIDKFLLGSLHICE